MLPCALLAALVENPRKREGCLAELLRLRLVRGGVKDAIANTEARQ